MPTAPKWINDVLEKIAPSLMREVAVIDSLYLNAHIKKIILKGDFPDLKFEPNFTIAFRVNATDSRHYTVSYGDANTGIIEVIVHLHGNAVGANFVDQLPVGTKNMKIAVLGCPKFYNPNTQRHIVVGDETSLGLMVSSLAAFEKNNNLFQFLIELDDENLEIPALLGLKNYTVFSKHGVFRNEDRIRQLPVFKDHKWEESNILLSGNVMSLQNFRKVLKTSKHRGKIYAKGFWMEGKKGL